jgi:Protein of unknown function (DUF3168)
MTAPALALLPDAERLVSSYLRSSSRIVALVGDRVYTAFPAQGGDAPLLLVQRVGGTPPLSQPLVVDTAQLQIDAYGGRKVDAWTLAETTRAVLTELEGEVRPEGVVSAVRFLVLRYEPDATYPSPRPRYLLDVELTVRTPAPGVLADELELAGATSRPNRRSL